MTTPIVFEICGITKQYPGTRALHDVSLCAHKGEIVGLVGENGAGKSTLLKIIMGVEQPTSGYMQLYGKPYAPANPKQANKSGIGMVYQEQSLILNLSVGHNIFFGQEEAYTKCGIIDWKRMYRDADAILKSLQLDSIKSRNVTGSYSFSDRQMIEIAKVIQAAKTTSSNTPILLLDEPTSVLTEQDIQRLFRQIRKLKEAGYCILFVSHRLEEVISLCDSVYVIKDGENVVKLEGNEIQEDVIYQKMVGRKSGEDYYRQSKQRENIGEELLCIENLGQKGYFQNVSFSLHTGEIIGLCGVIGSGVEHLCNVLAGVEPCSTGTISVGGKPQRFTNSAQALKNGIISVPQERNVEGVFAQSSILDNILISHLNAVTRWGFLSRKLGKRQCDRWIETLNIKCTGCQVPVSSLSGGNAQKVVFSRIMMSECKIIILNHPTRGVDVGAKEEIYHLIRTLTEQNYGIILAGDTLAECIGLSNRLLVMKDGVVTKEIPAPSQAKPAECDVIPYMM